MRASLVVAICAAFLATGYGVTACVGDDAGVTATNPSDQDAGEGGGGAKDLGAACVAAGECASANCADGVCCDSACAGTCEKCSLAGTVGKCLPIPDGEDPEKECPTTPLGDAGTTPTEGFDASSALFTPPDAGLKADDNQCAGSCNGKRACAYAGADRTCGTVYCGNSTEQGRAACDAKGHCVFGVEECTSFACADGSPGCKKTCTAETDCLATYFCDSATSTCKPKLANGTKCTSVVECQSGNCDDAVCCNTPCSGDPSLKCNSMGNVGMCVCPACTTGACALYYKDEDGDTYGDANGTVANGRAAYGCAAGPAPAGFVADKTDCYDGPLAIAKDVHPNQTAFFPTAYIPPGGSSTFDYNCNGSEQKETLEFPGSFGCGFCNSAVSPIVGCNFETTCKNVAGQHSGLACQGRMVANQCSVDYSGVGGGVHTTTGFTSVVACGASATKYTCHTCGALDTVNSPTDTATVVQQCH